MRVVLRVPGLGLAKSGFIVQMLYGMSGCIDTHNLTRFNLHRRRFACGTKATDRRRIGEYNDMVGRLGGTARLWDEWCIYVADRDANYVDADHVSRLHLTPLEG